MFAKRFLVCAWIVASAVCCPVFGAAVAQPEPESFELTAEDSVRVMAYWYAAPRSEDAPVALLLHNVGSSHFGWQPLLRPLSSAGLRVLSLDLRGHGRSKDLAPDVYQRMVRRERGPYLAMIHDVEAAIRWLTDEKDVPPEEIILVGGEYGSTLAFQAMARNPELGAAVALSPSTKYFQAPLLTHAEKYGTRPLLLVLPKQDLTQGSSKIAEMMRDNPMFEMKVYPRYDAQGVNMLGLSWRVEEFIVRWLWETFELGSS
ncbi:MAG: alpha/beta hydrolase family protein [Candidatus Krumholzibacteriia bacterium]